MEKRQRVTKQVTGNYKYENLEIGEMTKTVEEGAAESPVCQDGDTVETVVQEWCNMNEVPVIDNEPSFLDGLTPLEKVRYILNNCYVWRQWA
jgi:hypothetical protein